MDFYVYMYGSWIITADSNCEEDAEEVAFDLLKEIETNYPIRFRRIDEVQVD